MPATPPRVTVLGSMNMDISVTVPELPGPGATVLGSGARFAPGGKGGNQAVAAARLGAEVRMAGCVGHDEFGGQLLRALGAESVDTSAVREVQGVASGLALITVDSSGENMITVAAGANESVGDEEVSSALARPPDVLVISAEVPVPAIEAALDRARTAGRDGQDRQDRQDRDRDRDYAARGEDPPTGGLTAVLGKLREAAAAHDDELSDPGGLPQHG